MSAGSRTTYAVIAVVVLLLTAFLFNLQRSATFPDATVPAPPQTSPSTTPSTTPTTPSPKPAPQTEPAPSGSPPPPKPTTPPPAGAGHVPATAPPEPEIVSFPWPPPPYSAFATIAREWVAIGPQPTLASVAQRLERAFDAAGYGERSYYQAPGGFALVSRLEQIRADATPVEPPARWAIETPRVRAGFIDHIRALFNAPPGFYRVIVFAVTDVDFAAAGRAPTSREARTWISAGSLRLPGSIGASPYTDRHYTSALIYEFERRADEPEATMRIPSDAPGPVHLEKAGLRQALERQ